MRNILSTFGSRGFIIPLSGVVLALSLALPLSGARISYAQTVTTSITSSGLNTKVPTTPPANGVYDITGGTRVGTNLYHGLGVLDLARGDVANFLNKGSFNVNGIQLADGLATNNILARITGGQPSQIFGTLRTTDFGNANLFLLNPKGIVFGPTASLDIGATSVLGGPRGTGSFYASTADYLRLSDGVSNGYFYAEPIHTDVLTAAPVVAFGFLPLQPGTTRGTISVQGSNLSVADGQTIGLVGGNIEIQSGVVGGTTQSAQLSAPNGQIQLASAASPGEFLLTRMQPAPNINLDSFTSFSSVQLATGSLIDVTGTGKVSIRGGAFTLEVKEAVLSTEAIPSPPGGATQDSISLSRGSAIMTNTAREEAGADVQIVGRSVTLDGASITSVTTGDGPGGAITLTAEDSISLTGGAQIVSRTEGNGLGGNITVEATSETGFVTISGYDLDGTLTGVFTPFSFNPLTGDPVVVSGIYSLTSGTNPGGNISIAAPTVSLQDGAVVASVTSGNARGGNVTINSNMLAITGGATLISSTGQDYIAPDFLVTSGTGHGGDISVTATDSVTVSGSSLDFVRSSQITSETYNPAVNQALDEGHGGSITVTAPIIMLADAGTIRSVTQGNGTGGSIDISASDHLSVSGFSQDLGESSSILSLASGAPTGNGGPITISGSSVTSVTVEDGGRIATDHSPGGNGGDVTLTVHDLTVRNGGSITSSGNGTGSSGHIQITATGSLTVSGNFIDPNNPGAPAWSAVKNATTGASLNGGIDIRAGRLIMKNGPQNAPNQDVAQIESATEAPAGGTIIIRADEFISMSSGANILNRRGSFDLGSISMIAPTISLDKSAIRGQTNIDRNSGTITVNATGGNLTLSNDSHILTSTLQSSGNAGPIVALASSSIQLSGGSTMESSSVSPATGNGGAVTLTAGNQVSLSGTGTALQSTTAGRGNGGSITVNGGQSVMLSDNASISASSSGAAANAGKAGSIMINAAGNFESSGGKVSTTATQAQGGDINITAGQDIRLSNNASVSASSTGTGNAGNISAIAGDDFIMQNSSITTQATQASGGNIKIGAADQIVIRNSLISASVMGGSGSGSGGNISIDPNAVILQNSQILAQAILGNGGNISIITPFFFADQASLINASSQFGLNGTVTIQSPTSNLSGSLGTLATKPRQAQSLLTQRCAALANGQASSFVVAGREQLPEDPGGWLSSPLVFASLGESLDAGNAVASAPTLPKMAIQDTDVVSLRRLTPSGFLLANYADSEATGCHS